MDYKFAEQENSSIVIRPRNPIFKKRVQSPNPRDTRTQGCSVWQKNVRKSFVFHKADESRLETARYVAALDDGLTFDASTFDFLNIQIALDNLDLERCDAPSDVGMAKDWTCASMHYMRRSLLDHRLTSLFAGSSD